MNMLLNFGEVQSRIEFLSAIIYFTSSAYLFFLLYLKRFITQKEKNILKSISYGFLAIAIIFIIRQIIQHLYPEYDLYQSHISTIIFMMVLVLPIQFYSSEKVETTEFSLRHYIVNLLFMVSAYIYVQLLSLEYLKVNESISEIYLYSAGFVFIIYSFYMIYKFHVKLSILIKEEWLSVVNHKNEIFIYVSFMVFSILLILFVLFDVKYLYIRIILFVFSILNSLLFLKITMPYNAKGLLIDSDDNDNLAHLKEERHKVNRQLSDKIKSDELYGRLLKYFEKEKPFLKQDLKITEVALYLYSNKTYLSRIINDKNNQNFNQFVNSYRIEEVKNLFNENDKLNIQELCYMSGFGSMATFSIAFRFQLGYTPADWCKEQKMRIHNE